MAEIPLKKRKVFILEDDPTRVKWFKDYFALVKAPVEVTVVSSCKDVEQFEGGYDLIFLDHDLGGRQLEENEDCGLTFILMLKEKGRIDGRNWIGPYTTIVLHSYNPIGVRNMVNALHGYSVYTAPFRGQPFKKLITAITSPWVAKKQSLYDWARTYNG